LLLVQVAQVQLHNLLQEVVAQHQVLIQFQRWAVAVAVLTAVLLKAVLLAVLAAVQDITQALQVALAQQVKDMQAV
jgi:hypothetical protein